MGVRREKLQNYSFWNGERTAAALVRTERTNMTMFICGILPLAISVNYFKNHIWYDCLSSSWRQHFRHRPKSTFSRLQKNSTYPDQNSFSEVVLIFFILLTENKKLGKLTHLKMCLWRYKNKVSFPDRSPKNGKSFLYKSTHIHWNSWNFHKWFITIAIN